MEGILTKISQLDFSFLIYIAIELAILAGVYRFSKRLPRRWRTAVNTGIIILAMRIILFQNPLAWYVYHHTLDPEVIGWRQSSVLYDEFARYKKHDEVAYLAVGSSQTGAVYNFSRDTLANFDVKSLAGLSPVDLYLYRHNISNYEPKTILLYLSDFDLGRPPVLETLKLAPPQGIHFPDVYRNLRTHFSGEPFERTVKEMLAGELFPEYKYSFIFKGYIDQLFNKNSVFPSVAASMSDTEYEMYQFEQLKKVIDEEHIPINLYYLNKFISFFEERGISILILEGQYHPNAYTEKNLAVRKKVRSKLANLEKSHHNVRFIPDSEIMLFKTSDYRDAYHVNQEAGAEFTQHVVRYIE